MLNYNEKLDVRDLSCPLPLLKFKQAMGQLKIGQVLYIVVTGQQTVQDINCFATLNPRQLIYSYSAAKEKHFLFH